MPAFCLWMLFVSYAAVIDTPPGRLAISTDEGCLVGIDYVDNRTSLLEPATQLARTVVHQLGQYFNDPCYRFDLPLMTSGSSHQEKVWKQLRSIKPGDTMTYGQLAVRIGSGARAVGNSCRQNPVPIIIPCHRVVAASGIGGYGGHVNGKVLGRKHWLLEHEGASYQ